MTSRLSVAIIGAGNIAGGYDLNRNEGEKGVFSHAGAYAANGNFILQTVFDPDVIRAEAFKSDWGAKTLARTIDDVYGSYHDVVSVCSPDNTHFEIVKQLMKHKACGIVFLEKPAALDSNKINELIYMSECSNINIVVNFQRRNDVCHQSILSRISEAPEKILSVGGYYIKGLRHIGITLLDTLTFLLGLPDSVQAYHRVFNQEVNDYSYEFVLFYRGFNVVVRTTDVDRYQYNYHIFEVDLLLSDSRITILDNSRVLREIGLGDYAYSGVKVLDDTKPVYRNTGMTTALLGAVDYVYKVMTDEVPHTVNTLADSYNCMLIIERIVESFELGSMKLKMESGSWKK